MQESQEDQDSPKGSVFGSFFAAGIGSCMLIYVLSGGFNTKILKVD